MTSGAQDILIESHLDLTNVPLAAYSNTSMVSTVLGDTKPSTRTIRGSCATAPPAASAFGLPPPEFQWRAPQCVIIVDHSALLIFAPLWLDALYLRLRPSRFYLSIAIDVIGRGALYATRLTLQGSPGSNSTALQAGEGGQAFLRDCRFDSMGGTSRLVSSQASSIVLQNCSFANILQRRTFAAFDPTTTSHDYVGVFVAGRSTASVAVLDSSFANVDAPDVFWVNDALAIADGLTFSNVTTEGAVWDATGAVVSGDGAAVVKQRGFTRGAPVAAAVLADFPATRVPPLSADDAWFVSVQQSIAAATPAQIQEADDPAPPPLPQSLQARVAGNADPYVAVVFTAFEFQDAFHEGVRDIEVRGHLDLRNLPTPRDPIVEFGSTYPYKIGVPGPSTRSIRGRCEAPPGGAIAAALESVAARIGEAEPWAAPRCVIVTAEDFVVVTTSRLWLDGVHLQATESTDRNSLVGASAQEFGEVYITNSVVQGDRESDAVAVQTYRCSGGMYAQDSVFNACQGAQEFRTAVRAIYGTSHFKSCVFRGLSEEVPPEAPGAWETLAGAVQATGLNATLVLDGCTLSDIPNPDPVVSTRGAQVYSDDSALVITEGFTYERAPPLPLAALANRSARTPPPLGPDDPWFVAAQQALASIPASAYHPNFTDRPPPPPPPPAPAPPPAPPAPPPPPAAQPPDPAPNETLTPPGSGSVPAPGPAVPDTSGRTATDEAPETRATEVEGGEDSGVDMGAVAGGALAAVAVALVCVGVAVMAGLKRRRRRSAERAAGQGSEAPPVASASGPSAQKAGRSHEAETGAPNASPNAATALNPASAGPGPAQPHPSAAPPGYMSRPGAPPGPPGYHPTVDPNGHRMHAPHHNPPLYAGPSSAGHPHAHPPAYDDAYGAAMGGPGRPPGIMPHMHGSPGHMHVGHGAPAGAWDGGGAPPPLQRFGSQSSGSTQAAPKRTHNTSTATMSAVTVPTWSDFRRAAGVASSAVEELLVALDAVRSMQAPFCRRYHLGSSVERRIGGQAVVQFATVSTAGADMSDRVAIKFCLHREAFRRERELYAEPRLQAMMPATLALEDNALGTHRTPYGYVFPPFVIIERGQSLDEWAKENSKDDFVTTFQTLSHSVRALAKLHAFGYAHRDIKPGNILRRPKQHDWTLIDFGCAAQLGSTAPLTFSLKYAAPEVVAALEAGSRTVAVAAAVDIWAIGVIAWELCTQQRAFPVQELDVAASEAAAQAAIAGRAPLPWEGSDAATRERLGKLRGMRRTVLRCLERNPAKRPTAAALLRSWEHMFDNMHSRGTTWAPGGGLGLMGRGA